MTQDKNTKTTKNNTLSPNGVAYWWLNDESKQVLNRGYLLPGETVEAAIERITNAASKRLYNKSLKPIFKELIEKGWMSLSSPIWANMGTERGLPISCFNVSIDDSVESITDKLAEVITQTKIGGGTSGYFGNLRGRGAAITNNGKSSGAVSFMQLFDTTMNVVSQGATRRGAFAAYLDIDHPDIEELLQIRDIGYPIQNLFYAVCVPDYWMQQMIDGDERKREIWAKVLESRQQKGLPYIFFTDNVNRQRPEIYKKLGAKINASNLCFSGDTIVAVADGTNGKTIKELAEYSQGKIKFPVYSGTKRVRKTINGITYTSHKPEIQYAVAFKTGEHQTLRLTLSDGSSFECTENHQLCDVNGNYVEAKDALNVELESFFTFTTANHATKYRHIDSITNGFAKQHLMIYNKLVGKRRHGQHIDHVCNSLEYPDVVSNLQCIDRLRHFDKNSERMTVDNAMHRRQDVSVNKHNASVATSGINNARFCGITNTQLIDICKQYKRDNNIDVFTKTHYVELRKTCATASLPKSFSKYRFNGSLRTLCNIVNDIEDYNDNDYTLEEKRAYVDNDYERKSYILNTFYDGTHKKRRGLKVVSIDYLDVQDVYDLTVENNSNFYIITKTDDDKYENCSGVLVHNCSEIALPSTFDESFVCCLSSMNLALYDEWKDTDAVKYATYFLDAVMSEFIDKTTYNAKKNKGSKHLAAAHNFAKRHRALGLGVMGWHSYLQSKMIAFGSLQANAINNAIFKQLREQTYAASEELAEQYGPAPIFDDAIEQGIELTEPVRRNTTLLAVAPTTSSSSILGQVSAGIEPFSSNYYKAGLSKGNFIRKNKYLTELLESKGMNNESVWRQIMMDGGSVKNIVSLNDEEKEVFKTFKEINQHAIIVQAATRQQHIDQAQSLNINIPAEIAIKDVNKLIIEAWKLGVKTLYYQRSQSVSKEFLTNLVTCKSCES